ncbi:MAG: fatty acid desaturase family protein [Saprospiraceae bacterium]
MTNFDARDLNLDIDPTALKPLFKTNSLLHAGAIAYNWLLIIGSIYLGTLYPVFYVLAVIIIGARQHALAILMHDATHYRFLKNRKWNDLITNVTTMYPIFTSIEAYRSNHLRHHQHLNTEDDPDWVAKLTKRAFQFPKTKKEFLLNILAYFFLLDGIKDALWLLKRLSHSSKKSNKKTSTKFPQLVFFVLLFGTLTLFGLWKYYLLFWIIPYFSTFFMFQYIRSVAEHFGDLSYDHLLTSTRSVKATLIERLLLAPHNVGYHIEHHLYPGVPFYHLPQLHKLLMEVKSYREKAHITEGYMKGLLEELGASEVRHQLS